MSGRGRNASPTSSTAARRSTDSGAKPSTGRPRPATKPSTRLSTSKRLAAAVAKVSKSVGDDAARRELLAAALAEAVRVQVDPEEPATSRSRAAVEVRLLAEQLRIEDDRARAAEAVEASTWSSIRLEAL